MGKNIYLVKKIRQEDIDSLKNIFNRSLANLKYSNDIHEVLTPVTDFLKTIDEEIHICKISKGWQLLFQSHINLYDCTWKSMTDYIKKVLDDGSYIMIDDNGNDYTLDELKEDFELHKDGWTEDSYEGEKISQGIVRYDYVPKTEYISDNIRWTNFDFN